MTFTVPGKPVAWMRTNTFRGRKLTPKEQRIYQRKIQFCAKACGVRMFDGPVTIDVTVYLTGRVGHGKRGSGDWDNFGKTICDALEGIAYENDAQVVDGRVRKRPPDALGPRVEVRIEPDGASTP